MTGWADDPKFRVWETIPIPMAVRYRPMTACENQRFMTFPPWNHDVFRKSVDNWIIRGGSCRCGWAEAYSSPSVGQDQRCRTLEFQWISTSNRRAAAAT